MFRQCWTEQGSVRGMTALAVMATCVLSGFAEPPKPLPKETVMEWKQAGAEVGWMRLDDFEFLERLPENEGKPGDLPTFKFYPWKAGVLAKLSAATEPFGLDLSHTRITNAGLRELAGLKNLQALSLYGTKITDA